MQDLVFLVGAGLMRDADLPTANELTLKVESTLSDFYPELMPLVRFLEGAVQFGKGVRGLDAKGEINIEEILNICTFLTKKEKSYIYPFVSSWHEKVSEYGRLPETLNGGGAQTSFDFLIDYCKYKLKDWLLVQEANISYLENLRKFIDEGHCLRVFSLNYDEGIELAFERAVGPINEKWTNGFNLSGWDSGELNKEYDAFLYKLHGSLDWVDDEVLQVCSIKWPKAAEAEEIGSDFNPLLVFGTDNKVQATNPFLTLLYHFQDQLSRAPVLVAIGYSFSDLYVNTMILHAMRRNPKMRCITLGPSAMRELEKDIALSDFKSRFIPVEMTAKAALEGDEFYEKIRQTLKMINEEEPFT